MKMHCAPTVETVGNVYIMLFVFAILINPQILALMVAASFFWLFFASKRYSGQQEIAP
jgi:hypothetical protein